jgi:hypothetical protein
MYEEAKKTSGLLLLLNTLLRESRKAEMPSCFEALFRLLLDHTMHLQEFMESKHAVLLIQWAIRGSHVLLIDSLLRKGLSVHGSEKYPNILSPLQMACVPGNALCSHATFQRLLKHVDPERINEVDKNTGQGIIHNLIDPRVSERDIKLLAFLAAGADPNLPRWGKSPALVSFTLEKQVDAALILLQHGADPTHATKDGIDAALAAASRGSIRLLEKIKSIVPKGYNWQRTCRSHFTISRSPCRYFAARGPG